LAAFLHQILLKHGLFDAAPQGSIQRTPRFPGWRL